MVLNSPMTTNWLYNDGGRAQYFKGTARDCVVRSVAICLDRDYGDIYYELSHHCRTERKAKHGPKRVSARNGVDPSRQWFKRWMSNHGFFWIGRPFGSAAILPPEYPQSGRYVLSMRSHYSCIIDGVIHDNHNPTIRDHGKVYGMWHLPPYSLPTVGI